LKKKGNKKMKNKYLFVASLLTSALLLGAISTTARASITPPHGGWKWLGYAYKGNDSFHDAYVYAFAANSNATLSVTVYNDYETLKALNISALRIDMDWGGNYTSAFTSMAKPFVVPWQETRVIPITFTVPNLTDVSNLARYGYSIYLERVNSTSEPKEVIGSETIEGDINFVVYSPDQVDAQQAMQVIAHMQLTISPSTFNSTRARLLWTQAENETYVAGLYYDQGAFANAKTHYKNALSMMNQAVAAEQTKGGGLDDAQVQAFQSQANYLNGLSSMVVLVGVGVVLFAIGYIIRGFAQLRRPVPST
jgi:hypothetical protein